MRLRHLLAALAVSVAWGGMAEASPKAAIPNLDKVEVAYAKHRVHHRRVVYRNWGPRRSVRVVRYARPYRYGYYRPSRSVRVVRYARPYRYGYYRPARVVRYAYPYGYYRPAPYYSPVRYYAGYGRSYYRPYGWGGPYGGVSIGLGF
jgi:hypothetical protein